MTKSRIAESLSAPCPMYLHKKKSVKASKLNSVKRSCVVVEKPTTEVATGDFHKSARQYRSLKMWSFHELMDYAVSTPLHLTVKAHAMFATRTKIEDIIKRTLPVSYK